MPKGGIPDRWLDYSKVGTVIVGTPFIAFKVPLKEALCRNAEPQDRFTPSSLMEEYPNLGLVIDLTFTSRYYGPAEFLARGVQHCKILCPGHGSAPSDKEVKRFTDVVNEFLEERPSEEKLVGVHCTHGLNRTGFMICRYMIDSMGFSPEEAVKAFEDARGHTIERTEYLECLGCKPSTMSDRQPEREKSDRRSRKTRPSEGIQEQPYYNYQQHEASRNQDRHIPSNYGWSRGSERLGDPYQDHGRSRNVQRGSYQQSQYGSHSGNAPRHSYQQRQYDSLPGNVHGDSYYCQYDSRSGNVQSDSYQQRQYDSRSGYGQRDGYGYQQAASASYQNTSDSYHARQQGGQRQKEDQRPNHNRGESSGLLSSGDYRFNSKKRFNQDSRQEDTTTTQTSCWF